MDEDFNEIRKLEDAYVKKDRQLRNGTTVRRREQERNSSTTNLTPELSSENETSES